MRIGNPHYWSQQGLTPRYTLRNVINNIEHSNKYNYSSARYITKKLIISGDTIVEKTFPFAIQVGYVSSRTNFQKSKSNEKTSFNINRSRTNLVNTINCNKTKYTKFITLTQKENELERTVILKRFKLFLLRWKRKYRYNLPYVAVIEPQERGSLHIHLVAFLDTFIPYEDINSLWSWGFTDIKVLKNNDVGRYMAKYFTKDSDFIKNVKNFNKKIIFKSRGLKKSVIKYDFTVNKNIKGTKLLYEVNYEFVFKTCLINQRDFPLTKKLINYKEYKVPNLPLLDLIDEKDLPF
jgi:hypothetical protein